jgi:hypothetical protein
MERAVAPLLLQRRASGRRALSRLRDPLRRRDPSGRHRPRRHLRPRVHRYRTRDQGLGVKRTAALATLIRLRLLARRCRTRDGVQDQHATLTSLIRLRLLERRCPTRDWAQEPRAVPTILIRRYRSVRR